MIDPQEALNLTLQQTFPWGAETIPLDRAHGRVLRQFVHADRDQPPFDRVAMDGIALDYSRVPHGDRRRFPVSPPRTRGLAPPCPFQDSTRCVEVMTGAPLPPGTTTVIRYEDLPRDSDGNLFRAGGDYRTDNSIHRRGSAGQRRRPRYYGPAGVSVPPKWPY